MKFILVLSLVLTFAFGCTGRIEAQSPEIQKVQINQQKQFTKSKLTVKFVSLIEDSRCPVDTKCIQAGNARIKIEVSRGTEEKTFELNTNSEEKSVSFGNFEIELINLTPIPKSNIRINRNGYVAEIAVRKLS